MKINKINKRTRKDYEKKYISSRNKRYSKTKRRKTKDFKGGSNKEITGTLEKGDVIGRGTYKTARELRSSPTSLPDDLSNYVVITENTPGAIEDDEITLHKYFAEFGIAPKLIDGISMEESQEEKRPSYILEKCDDLGHISNNHTPLFKKYFQYIFNDIVDNLIPSLLDQGYVYWDIKLGNICILGANTIFNNNPERGDEKDIFVRFIDFDSKFCYSVVMNKETQNVMEQMMITMLIVIILKYYENRLYYENKQFLVEKYVSYYGTGFKAEDALNDFLTQMNNMTNIWTSENWSPVALFYYYITDNEYVFNDENKTKILNSQIYRLRDDITSIIRLNKYARKPIDREIYVKQTKKSPSSK